MIDYLTSGRLEDHPFADLAGKLFRESRTGQLVLESDQRRRTVWFLGGNPVAVVSQDPQDHIAQVLLEHGKISAEEAQQLSALPETRDALGKPEFLSKETLNWGVKSRFVNLCYDLFRWEDGDYAFTEGEPPRDLIFLKVPAHSLIFKGVGFLARASVFDAVPDDAVFVAGPIPPHEARYLAPEVRDLLEECQPGRTVTEVLGGREDADQDRRLLYALICLGPVALSRASAAEEGTAWPVEEQGFTLDSEEEMAGAGHAPQAGAYEDDQQFAHAPEQFPTAHPDLALPSPEPMQFPGESFAPGHGHSDGSFSFDTEAAPGSFPSFDAEPAPVHLDAAQPDPTEKPAAQKTKAKKSSRSLHLPRWAGIALGSVAAAAVLGAAGWWWLGGDQPPPTKPPIDQAALAVPPPMPAPPAPAPDAAAPGSPEPGQVVQAPVPETAPASSPAPEPAPVPVAAQVPASPPATVPTATAAASRPAASGASGGNRHQYGLEMFKAGDLDAAAAVWETLLSEENRGRFTVLLMTACQTETIRAAQQALAPQKIYLATKKVDGRSCFRVCAETFDSRDAAARALAGLPGEYRAAGAAVRTVAEVLANR